VLEKIKKIVSLLTKKRVIIAGCAALSILALLWYAFLPLRHKGGMVDEYINKGQSLHAIARDLRVHKVITLSQALLVWMKFAGGEKHIIAGHYVFFQYEGAASAARKLLNGHPLEVKVTVPEGLTIEQIAGLYYAAFHIDTLTFDSLCRSSGFAQELGISAPTLEGYLFPDTYRFSDRVTPREAVKRMVERFKYATKDLVNDTNESRALHDAVILGSIIEKEAARPDERARISAVFHNRLRLHMPLGADPTVRYIFRKFSGPLFKDELQTNSPYNTREHEGLPPGPICSPGLAAIQAALQPLPSKELYFVARWDGSGSHEFSCSNAEHNRKKLAIRRNLLEHKSQSIDSVSGRAM
jgi:UPF0755 protein